MSEIQLTQSADYLLCALYEAYRTRHKNGESISDAKVFGGSEIIQKEYCPEWPTTDITEAARELERCGMLNCFCPDNGLENCQLLPSGIAYMEHRFGAKFDQLIQRIATLRAAVIG